MEIDRRKILAFLVWMGGSWTAHGQVAPASIDRTLEEIRQQTRLRISDQVPPEQRVLKDYGVIMTGSILSLDDYSSDNHTLREFDSVGYFRLNLDDVHEFYLRGRSTYQDFNTGDSFDGQGDQWISVLEEAYYTFDYQRQRAVTRGESISDDLRLKIGRQFMTWAGGLVFSNYLDGAMVDIDVSPFGAKLLGGVTPTDMIDFDPSRPDFDEHTSRVFYGAMLDVRIGSHHPYIYFLRQDDHNPDESVAMGSILTRFNYDSSYLGIGSRGAWSDHLLYQAELVYESGHGLSRAYTDGPPPMPHSQTSEGIEAFAADLDFNYVWSDEHKPLLGLEFIAATGDSDRVDSSRTVNGNKIGTMDRAFNAFGYVGNSLAFEPVVSNVLIVHLRGSAYPLPQTPMFSKLQLVGDLYVFNKFNEDAPIGEPSESRRFLGIEPDISVNWEILEDVTFVSRYGVFFSGNGLSNNDDLRQFLYIGVSYAF
jgi:hypothetical protein